MTVIDDKKERLRSAFVSAMRSLDPVVVRATADQLESVGMSACAVRLREHAASLAESGDREDACGTIVSLHAELSAVRARLEEVIGYQLGGPCVSRGEEGTVLDVADRVSRGVTELNEKCRRRGEERDQLRALVADCVAVLVAVMPHVDEALRASFAEDVAALVAREQSARG